MAKIIYHDIIHGIQAGRVMWTAYLEAKLIHQLMTKREEVLYEVFMDTSKKCDALD